MATYTQTLGDSYATTVMWRAAGAARDQIFKVHPLQGWFLKKGKIVDGGDALEFPVQTEKNRTLTSIAPGGSVTIRKNEPDQVVRYAWSDLTCHLKRSLILENRNKGKAKMQGIMTRQVDNLFGSVAEDLETMLGASTATTSLDVLGLQRVVPADPTAAYTLGGHDQSTATWWRNQTNASVGAFSPNGIPQMRRMVSLLEEQGQGAPDGIFTTRTIFDQYADEADEVVWVKPGGTLDFGFDAYSFLGLPMTHSPAIASGTMYFLNSKSVFLMLDSGGNKAQSIFTPSTDWMGIPDQPDSLIQHYLAHAQLCTDNRRAQGQLSGIT